MSKPIGNKPLTRKEMTDLYMERLGKVQTENPTPDDVSAFQMVLEEYPEMWTVLGDLASRAQHRLISDMMVNPGVKASLRMGVGKMRKVLTKPKDGAIENMVIDEVILCWLRMYETEKYWQNLHVQERVTHASSEYWDKRLDAAQQRYLRALESLARIRKLNKFTIRLEVEHTARTQLPPYKVIDAA